MTSGMISAAVWVALGVAVAIGGIGLDFGTLATPASGFVPTVAGAALAAIGMAVLYQEWRVAHTIPPAGDAVPATERWRVVAAAVALLAYGFLLQPLGLVVTTLLVLGVLFRLVGGLGWPVAITATLAGTGFSYLLFARWLRVPFPTGPWGF